MLAVSGNARWKEPMLISKPLSSLAIEQILSTTNLCTGGIYNAIIVSHTRKIGMLKVMIIALNSLYKMLLFSFFFI